MTGDDLTDFVNNKLFPYLKKFKTIAESADTIEYKIGEIFLELKNRIQSGYNLQEVINRIDELRFRTMPRSMKWAICMKIRSKTWTRRAEMVANIIPPDPSSLPS